MKGVQLLFRMNGSAKGKQMRLEDILTQVALPKEKPLLERINKSQSWRNINRILGRCAQDREVWLPACAQLTRTRWVG